MKNIGEAMRRYTYISKVMFDEEGEFVADKDIHIVSRLAFLFWFSDSDKEKMEGVKKLLIEYNPEFEKIFKN